MRLSNSEHESHAWRIAEVAPDFRLEDVWALPAQGRREDFAKLLEVVASLDPKKSRSRATRTLFGIRYRLGEWLGWDEQQDTPLSIPESRETTLSARLPEDLRDTATGVELTTKDFIPLYRTDVEWAAEISNKTVHAVMHLAWVEKDANRYQGQMGVYVKPRGRLGTAYMAAIAPFRHRIVYPALMREIERGWVTRMAEPRRRAL
ncbi:MAG TPA: DUF2867 domain-containing protein [Solirubrobacteraceae bacterium]|jgi:hypothetical protein